MLIDNEFLCGCLCSGSNDTEKGLEFDTKNVITLQESKIVFSEGFNSGKTVYGILITSNNTHSDPISILVHGFIRQNTYFIKSLSQIIIEYMGNSICKSLLIYEYKNIYKFDYLGTQIPMKTYENINNIGRISSDYLKDNCSFKMNYKTKIISFKFDDPIDILEWSTALTDDGNSATIDDMSSTVSGSSDDNTYSFNCGCCLYQRNEMTHMDDQSIRNDDMCVNLLNKK